MPPIKLELQHVLLTKQNNSSLLFMHLKKAQHPTLVRRNKMSFLRSFISRAQHLMHVRNNKMSLLKLLQRKVKFNMFWSKPHSLAPPPDSPSRIEELLFYQQNKFQK
ncbi:hypothetical protein AABB24_019553 [Solanum stoloniferum]|uniref:Uncharacterized protein n=1 Tax=Solanum stoloniferum TaxID=62892 RepID=A0ABD2TGM1_9SOLN